MELGVVEEKEAEKEIDDCHTSFGESLFNQMRPLSLSLSHSLSLSPHSPKCSIIFLFSSVFPIYNETNKSHSSVVQGLDRNDEALV